MSIGRMEDLLDRLKEAHDDEWLLNEGQKLALERATTREVTAAYYMRMRSVAVPRLQHKERMWQPRRARVNIRGPFLISRE